MLNGLIPLTFQSVDDLLYLLNYSHPMDSILTLLCGELLQELVAAFAAEAQATGNPQLMLTAAVAAGKGTIDAGYEIAEIAK